MIAGSFWNNSLPLDMAHSLFQRILKRPDKLGPIPPPTYGAVSDTTARLLHLMGGGSQDSPQGEKSIQFLFFTYENQDFSFNTLTGSALIRAT
jgi:hypothetical protein